MSRPLTKKDLWLAIFSLDAYQRGNEVFVGGEGRGLSSVQIEGVGGALNALLSLPARQYAGCE